jgi:hypothetical protein
MATTLHTERAYSSGDAVGVAVSPSSKPPAPAHRVPIFSSLGACCLQYALVDLRLGRIDYPWGMYYSPMKEGSNAPSLFDGLGPLLRCRECGVAVPPTKGSSFALKLRCTSFHFSFATLPKLLVGSSTLLGLSKVVYTSVWHAQLRRLSSKSVMYESPLTDTRSASIHASHRLRLDQRSSLS